MCVHSGNVGLAYNKHYSDLPCILALSTISSVSKPVSYHCHHGNVHMTITIKSIHAARSGQLLPNRLDPLLLHCLLFWFCICCQSIGKQGVSRVKLLLYTLRQEEQCAIIKMIHDSSIHNALLYDICCGQNLNQPSRAQVQPGNRRYGKILSHSSALGQFGPRPSLHTKWPNQLKLIWSLTYRSYATNSRMVQATAQASNICTLCPSKCQLHLLGQLQKA